MALVVVLVVIGATAVAHGATRDYHYQLSATADRIFTNPADYTAFRERREVGCFSMFGVIDAAAAATTTTTMTATTTTTTHPTAAAAAITTIIIALTIPVAVAT